MPWECTRLRKAVWDLLLSAHVGLISADVGDNLPAAFLASPLEPVVAPSILALADMC